MQLQADKLFFLHEDETKALNLPAWLPLSEAQDMLLAKLQVCICMRHCCLGKADHV